MCRVVLVNDETIRRVVLRPTGERRPWLGHDVEVQSQLVSLAALLIAPGLLALMLLMEWLERVLTRNMIVDDILLVLTGSYPPDEVEVTAARRLANLLGDVS